MLEEFERRFPPQRDSGPAEPDVEPNAESDGEGLASDDDEAAESPRPLQRIPLLIPPQKSIGQNGLPICVYIRSDEDEPRVWWAADEEEAAEIERFCRAAESFDWESPETHVVEF